MKSKVKLYVYEEHGKETVIDIFHAKEWSEFMLVDVDLPLDNEQIDQLNRAFEHVNKQIIILPKGIDVKIYGVREQDDEPIELTPADESDIGVGS